MHGLTKGKLEDPWVQRRWKEARVGEPTVNRGEKKLPPGKEGEVQQGGGGQFICQKIGAKRKRQHTTAFQGTGECRLRQDINNRSQWEKCWHK